MDRGNVRDRPWYAYLNVDLFLLVLNRSLFHPFIAWLIPLCFRAVATPYSDPSMLWAVAYAVAITLWTIFLHLNRRFAYGIARDVDLEDEVIVITGGASGLGLLIAEVYGMRGAAVAVLDVRNMETESRGVEFYQCDVGDRAQVEGAAKLIEADLGTPTILINNAAVVSGKSLLELSAEETERNLHVNLLSHFYTLQTFLPGMLREKRGTIVTIASVLGHLGCKNLSDYTAAKAGLLTLHASLKEELSASSNIKTILVTPGQIATPLFAGVRTPSPFFAPVLEPVDVAKEIIRAVDGGVSTDITLPLYSRWLPVLPVLPVSVQRLLRWASGIDRAMENFVGRERQGQGQGEGAGRQLRSKQL
ncbi:MAG: hypothetical protein M1838_003739 [Thelocarpon superellum]|nr:MAG: hypothetical protein M1838_003739 [Thelocarpon superellum]